jgi:LruC domain-containing protein
MFPNFSLPPEGGMKLGDTVALGRFKAGSAIGFTIVSNGWNGNQVNPYQTTNSIFYSLKDLNPETDPTLRAHTVLLSKPEDGLLILGFEDLNRAGGDHDFNDVLVAIKVTPFSAIDRSNVQSLVKVVVVDTDGDTIPDNLDAFPLDPERAARRFYPNANGFGSLAFEDLWPKKGDFDMNDLLVAYRVVEILNAKNQIVDLQLNYEIRARGAGSNNGFGIHFPGISSSAIDPASTTLSINNQTPVAMPVEAGQSEAVFILSGNVTPLTNTGQAFPCSMMNTVMKCSRTPAVPLTATIHFKQPQTTSQFPVAPYNPFIFRTEKRGLEVHLVDHPPTAKADPKLFGTLDDRSDASKGLYYRTAGNQPWALDVPETWRYPTEWNSIVGAYPDFGTWAASGGTTAQDWYVSKVVDALSFK